MPAIRVITFNVQGWTDPKHGPNTWSQRETLNVATLLRHAPDLIGFQEVWDGTLAAYRERLGGWDGDRELAAAGRRRTGGRSG